MGWRVLQFSVFLIVDRGLKMRVTGRNKNWVQVSDPATAATGWIYSRFLKPTAPPPQ
jgi:SH3-like domain-containing protein